MNIVEKNHSQHKAPNKVKILPSKYEGQNDARKGLLRIFMFIVVSAIVVFILVLNLYTVLLGGKSSVTPKSPEEREKRSSLVKERSDEYKENKEHPLGEDFVYHSSNIREPFSRYTETNQQSPRTTDDLSTPSLVLTGVIWNNKSPIAILYDQKKNYLAKVNDTVLGYRVLAIQERGVLLERAGVEIELKVWKQIKGLAYVGK